MRVTPQPNRAGPAENLKVGISDHGAQAKNSFSAGFTEVGDRSELVGLRVLIP